MIEISNIKNYEPLWDQWYVDSFIGEGSFGKVYKVRREESGQTIYAAAKILSIPFDDNEKQKMQEAGLDDSAIREFSQSLVKNIVNEIDLINNADSDDLLVSYQDIEVHEKDDEVSWDILLLMDLLPSLGDYVKDHPLSQAEVVILGTHISQALALCVQNNTIHLNIIPNNIFISPSGTFMLGDIGIAKHIELNASGLAMRGTYTTMAPEVFKGETFDTSADTYALGMLMYALLNRNRAPFFPPYPQTLVPSDIDQALQKRISGETIPVLRGASRELNAFLLKTCTYNRQDRFSGPTVMGKALEAIATVKGYDGDAIAKKMKAIAAGMKAEAINQAASIQTGPTTSVLKEAVPSVQRLTPMPDSSRNSLKNPLTPAKPSNKINSPIGVESESQIDLPNQIDPPPNQIDSPDPLNSQTQIDSPNQMDSPDQLNLQTQIDPPNQMDLPNPLNSQTQIDPPNQMDSPNQANPPNQIPKIQSILPFLKKRKLPLAVGLSIAVLTLIITAVMYLSNPSLIAKDVTVYSISINGQTEFILSHKEEAQAVLDELKGYYIDLANTKNSAHSVSSATFEEIVEIVTTQALPEDITIQNKQEALDALFKGRTQVIEHTVEQGETVQGIAQKFNITTQAIGAENEGLTEESQLTEGSLLKLAIPQPYLHVILQGQYVITGEIDFDTEMKKDDNVILNTTEVGQKGEKGVKDITCAYISRNSVVIEETVLGETVTKEPVKEIILEGTKPLIVTLNSKSITNYKLANMVSSGEIPKNVTHLYLSSNQISDITPLKSLLGLAELYLDDNNITELKPLQSLIELKTLRLNDNIISNIAPLGSLTKLTVLHLDSNSISDIATLKSLTKLTSLSLGNNEISDVSSLGSLTSLTTLYLTNNSIKDFNPLKGLVNLNELSIIYNPGYMQISDLRNALPECIIL